MRTNNNASVQTDAFMIRKVLEIDFPKLEVSEPDDTGFFGELKARNGIVTIEVELDSTYVQPGISVIAEGEEVRNIFIPFDGNITAALYKAVPVIAKAYADMNTWHMHEERYTDASAITEAEYRMVCNCISWLQTDYETCRRLLGRNYMDAICGMAIVVDWYATGTWSDGDPSDTSPYEYGKFVESPYGERTYFTTGYTGIAGDYWNSFWK